ncbi:MAG: glycoside hydrolase 100 family protein [Nanoarchaeota archaeon]|nr:glycoside hydrolase 100 family protein [Nanoarchaeota archaeon]
MDIEEEAYKQAILTLKKCSTPDGFYAAFPGYQMVFGRDSMITSLGASLVGEDFKQTFKQSLITLAKNQSPKGQIPNAIDVSSKPHIDYKSIDSTLWFIIGEYIYSKRYKDRTLLDKHKKNISSALAWLSYQDMGEDSMLEQLPTTDWQDAFPHRYGHTINTQALYYFVLSLVGKHQEAEKLKKTVNENKDDGLWNEEFYLPWRWKNHNTYHEKGEWFDSLGNLLAIIFELADKNKAEKILKYINDKKVNKPYPIKAIYPPILQGTKDWQDYFLDCDAGIPYHYLNGGIWTYIGSFYVLALVKMKKFKETEEELKNLAKANMLSPYFNEWINGETGEIGESASGNNGNQAWNAGMYILAYNSTKKRKVLI